MAPKFDRFAGQTPCPFTDHSVFVEDATIPIKFLVNDAVVVQFDIVSVTHCHLELAHHDVVLAERLPDETYLETGGRSAFDP